MRVNFSITNQLATPSIHAAALANRPPAGQPGRLFVDTDSPSTGIYRDTGTVWILISSPGAPEADTLQAVTDRGNTTTNNIVLQYGNTEDANKINFYNTTLSESEYVIEKRGAGGTTNDVLTLEATGSNTNTGNPLGLYVDGSQENLITYYGPSYQGRGLRLNLGSEVYEIGDFNGTGNGTGLIIENINQIVKTVNQGNDIGLNLDFATNNFTFGDLTGNDPVSMSLICDGQGARIYNAYYGTENFVVTSDINDTIFPQLKISSTDGTIKTLLGGNDIGLKLDFANGYYQFGDISGNYVGSGNNGPSPGDLFIFNNTVGDVNGFSVANSYTNPLIFLGDFIGQGNGLHFVLDDTSQIIQTFNQGNDIGLKLDFANSVYSFGWSNFVKGLAVNQSNNTIYLGDDAVSGTGAGIKIENDTDIFIGDYTQGFSDGLTLSITSTDQVIKSKHLGNDIGLKLDFVNNYYSLGDINTLDKAALFVDNSSSVGYINGYEFNNGTNGISIAPAVGYAAIGDFANNINNTFLIINDATQTWELSGNLLSGSSGGSSGQHIKVKVGGTDYKIKLENP